MDPAKIIFEICDKNEDGVTQQELFDIAKSYELTPEQVKNALNTCMRNRSLQALKMPSGVFVFKSVSAEERRKFQGLNEDEILVYQKIKESGDKGLWTNDLKKQTRLMQAQVTKALRILETRNLIKAVKTIAAKNRKVYMITEMEPSRDVTGGVFYSDQELDEELVSTLYQLCSNYVIEKGYCKLDDVYNMVKESDVVSADLRLEDVEIILGILCYDGKLEKFADPRSRQSVLYRPSVSVTLDDSPLSLVPCGWCPLRGVCVTKAERVCRTNPTLCNDERSRRTTPFGWSLLDVEETIRLAPPDSSVPNPECPYVKFWEKGEKFEVLEQDETLQ